MNKPNSKESKLLSERNATSEKLTPFAWTPMGSEIFCDFAGMTYPQTFQDSKRTVLAFDTGSFASYSQDQLTKLKSPQVGVGDLGTSENKVGFHVHFFWRRVYVQNIKISMYVENIHSFNFSF